MHLFEETPDGVVLSLGGHTYFFPDEPGLRNRMIAERLKTHDSYDRERNPTTEDIFLDAAIVGWGYFGALMMTTLALMFLVIAGIGVAHHDWSRSTFILGAVGIATAIFAGFLCRTAIPAMLEDWREYRLRNKMEKFEKNLDFAGAAAFVREHRTL